MGATPFDGAWSCGVDDDIARATRATGLQRTGWFGGSDAPETASHRVGDLRCGVMLAFGATIDP